jgi:hypothetical protein
LLPPHQAYRSRIQAIASDETVQTFHGARIAQ